MNEERGVLQLQPGVGRAVQYSPGAIAANFRIRVSFTNPFHPAFSPWDYGVKFRDDGQTFQMFVFNHEGVLSYIKGDGTDLQTVSEISVQSLRTSGGARNDITLLVVETRAFVLLDELLIGIYQVGDPERSGEVSIVTDVFNQTTVVGAHTEFLDLAINSAGMVAHSSSGELVRGQPDEPAVGPLSLPTSAGYSRVVLLSPTYAFSGDYSYGFLFRSDEIRSSNWLVLDDSKNWRHLRRSDSGAEFIFANGTAELLDTSAGGENVLEFLSTGQENKIYLNGEFLTNIGVLPEDLPFSIAPIAAFNPDHQTGGLATEYRDFVVWSVAE